MYRKSLGMLVGMVIIAVAVILFFADIKLKASILEIAQSKAQIKVVEIINTIVNDKIVAQTNYHDIVCVHKDSEGRIVLLQANTVMLNQIMARTTMEVADSLEQLKEDSLEIPLGQISGSQIFAGYGPKIKVKIIPASQIQVAVENDFEQAGINQTRHRIYFKISSRVRVAVPLIDKDVNVSTTIPLAETIIVGDVPETYVNFKGSDESLYPFIKSN